jgi:exopolysaccharide biosynthesis polyprenyl glycosylphosphotransferase
MDRIVKNRALVAGMYVLDAICFSAAWIGVYQLRKYLGRPSGFMVPINPFANYVAALPIYLLFWASCSSYQGLYRFAGRITSLNQISAITKTFISGLIGSLAIAYLFKQWDIGRVILFGSSFLFTIWLFISRNVLRAWKQSQIRRNIGVTRVLVIGLGRTARRAMNRIVTHPEGGYRFVGFVDSRSRSKAITSIAGAPVLGSTSELERILKKYPAEEVFLAVPHMPQAEVMSVVMACEHAGVSFKIVSNLFEVITSQVQIDVIDEVPVVELKNTQPNLLHAILKRIMDIAVASLLLTAVAIPLTVIALLVRLDSPGPVFFTQERVGQKGRRFRIFKFRTMRTETDPYAVAPDDPTDPRITRFGRFLRRTSLDEFPQLFNVLLGHMSMVGPRPEMPFLVEQYEEWQKLRLDVKPGITGLWQIVGRKNLPLALNMEYDFYYIKNQSLLFDVIILIKTIPAVIFGRGAF